jgi:transcriptional regulator of acetoin/glycerol metabolism
VERAVVLCETHEILVEDLPPALRAKENTSSKEDLSLNSLKDVAEKEMIESTLVKHNYNVSSSARELEMHRATLYRKIAKYNICIE